jgi:hypothetical protein
VDAAYPPVVSTNYFIFLKIKMLKKFLMLDSYKAFVNLVFGILLTLIGWLLVNKLGQIDDSIKEMTKLQQTQLIRNENFELRIQSLEIALEVAKINGKNKK